MNYDYPFGIFKIYLLITAWLAGRERQLLLNLRIGEEEWRNLTWYTMYCKMMVLLGWGHRKLLFDFTDLVKYEMKYYIIVVSPSENVNNEYKNIPSELT